jgi:hypothetical protein
MHVHHRVHEAFAVMYAERFKNVFEVDGSKVPADVRQFDAACKALFSDQEKVSRGRRRRRGRKERAASQSGLRGSVASATCYTRSNHLQAAR